MSDGGGNRDADRVSAPVPLRSIESLGAPPSFSVVVPAYEAATAIGETIESVLSQSPPPRDVVIVDDGSTDDLETTLAPFEGRIKLVRQANRGVAAARNAGLRECAGDFVLVVDADDVLLPGKLDALSRLGRRRPDLDLLCTDLHFEVEGKREGRFGEANRFPVEGQRREILERCFTIQPATRRSRLEELGGFDESLRTAEDWDCALRLILDGSVAGLYDEPLGVYRIHPGSLTDSRRDTLHDRVRMLEKARSHQVLRPAERPLLERSLESQRYRAALADAQAALAEGGTHARRRGLELARLSTAPGRDRVWGLALFVLPTRLRSLLRRRGSAGSQLSRLLPGGKR